MFHVGASKIQSLVLAALDNLVVTRSILCSKTKFTPDHPPSPETHLSYWARSADVHYTLFGLIRIRNNLANPLNSVIPGCIRDSSGSLARAVWCRSTCSLLFSHSCALFRVQIDRLLYGLDCTAIFCRSGVFLAYRGRRAQHDLVCP